MNWNGFEDTIECIESLYKIDYPNYDLIIVDNDSIDESIKKIKEYTHGINDENNSVLQGNLILIENNKNYGFAEGNNIGIRTALKNFNPDYVLLLNNDTIVHKNFLTELIKVAENNHNIGSVQSLLLRPGGKIVDSLGQELNYWSSSDLGIGSEYQNNLKENLEIFGACAASVLYRYEVLNEIGLFDKDFFVLFEDVDLSWRIRLKGLKSILAVNSIVYHKRNTSKKFLERKKFDLGSWNMFELYHASKNMLIIAIRYHSTSSLLHPKYLYKAFLSLSTYYLLSLRYGNVFNTSKIILKNLKLRKELSKNPLLTKIQIRWIVN